MQVHCCRCGRFGDCCPENGCIACDASERYKSADFIRQGPATVLQDAAC